MSQVKVKALKTFRVVKWIYFLIGLLLSFSLTIFFFTNGSLKDVVLNNFDIILFPLIIPLFYSIIGLHYFTYYDDHGVISVHCRCVGFGKFFSSMKTELEIPSKEIEKYKIRKTFFSFKKTLTIYYILNKKSFSKSFNISMLSSDELIKLISSLDNIKSAN